jgi:NADH-quinone oxidoreductase subunit M
MITALLLFWPAIAGLLVLLLKGQNAKKFAFGAALVEFLLALYLPCSFTSPMRRRSLL